MCPHVLGRRVTQSWGWAIVVTCSNCPSDATNRQQLLYKTDNWYVLRSFKIKHIRRYEFRPTTVFSFFKYMEFCLQFIMIPCCIQVYPIYISDPDSSIYKTQQLFTISRRSTGWRLFYLRLGEKLLHEQWKF